MTQASTASSYFHVFVRERGASKWKPLFVDGSDNDVRRLVVRPYSRGKPLFVRNIVFDATSIEEIRIVRTLVPADAALSELARRYEYELDHANLDAADSGLFFLGVGPGYEATDLVDEFDNVTHVYVGGPAGDGYMLHRVWRLVSENALISTLVATAIGLAISALWTRLYG